MTKKNSGVFSPHDAVFKAFLSVPEIANDFIALHLPAPWRALCDLNTLKLEPTSFIEEDLKRHACDILWSMKTTTGEDGYIYLLIEHQSTEDKLMAFRQMRYAIAAMQQHIKAGHDTLPLVIPLQFYAGERTPYPYSRDWFDCFAQPKLAKQIYTQPFPLVDITTMEDEEIKQHHRLSALTLVMKNIRHRDMMRVLDGVIDGINRLKSHSLARSLLYYILHVGNESLSEFMHALAQRLPEQEEGGDMVTLAQMLRNEGHQKGLQEGREEGLQEGEQKGLQKGLQKGALTAALNIAQAMLTNGLDRQSVMQMTGLTEAQLQQLKP